MLRIFECLGGPLDGVNRSVRAGAMVLHERLNDGWHSYRVSNTDDGQRLQYMGKLTNPREREAADLVGSTREGLM